MSGGATLLTLCLFVSVPYFCCSSINSLSIYCCLQLAAQRHCCSFCYYYCQATQSCTQATLPYISRPLTPSALPPHPQFRSAACCTFTTVVSVLLLRLPSLNLLSFYFTTLCTLHSALATCHDGKLPYPHSLRTYFSVFHADTKPFLHIPCTNIAAYCGHKWNLLCT